MCFVDEFMYFIEKDDEEAARQVIREYLTIEFCGHEVELGQIVFWKKGQRAGQRAGQISNNSSYQTIFRRDNKKVKAITLKQIVWFYYNWEWEPSPRKIWFIDEELIIFDDGKKAKDERIVNLYHKSKHKKCSDCGCVLEHNDKYFCRDGNSSNNAPNRNGEKFSCDCKECRSIKYKDRDNVDKLLKNLLHSINGLFREHQMTSSKLNMSREQFMEWLLPQLKEGMTLENYGTIWEFGHLESRRNIREQARKQDGSYDYDIIEELNILDNIKPQYTKENLEIGGYSQAPCGLLYYKR